MKFSMGAAVALALALAACSGKTPHPHSAAPPPKAAVTATETDAVFALLLHGKAEEARKALKTLAKRDPMNVTVRLLGDSIDRDPKDLLGPQNYPYTVRAGDTITSLSERFLGNRLKAYQLLRYNGLQAPSVLTPGQVLRIPGEPPRPEPVRPEPPRRPEPAPRPRPTAPKPVAAKPAAPVANPAAARQLRAAGLAALNGGQVSHAVALLGRAAQLDPGNPLIGRDLARAQRIAATVRAHR